MIDTIQKVKEEAAAIIKMAPGWEIVNDDSCWMFMARERSSGAEFHVKLDHPKKYTVSCNWPCDKAHLEYRPEVYGHIYGEPNVTSPRINVSKSRGPRALIGDVERRLLPFMRTWLPRMKALASNGDRDNDNQARVLEIVSEKLGRKPREHSHEVYGGSDTRIRKIRVGSKGETMTVELEYSLPIELLDDLVELMRR